MGVNTLAVQTQGDVSAILAQADTLVKSGYLPKTITTPQQAFAIMTMGRELGIDAWAALNGINVIQGKPTIAPQLMLALINRSGELADMAISDDGNVCAVTMTRKGRSPHTETFSMQDAAAMQLATRDNWKKQAPVMRKWRAVAACARVVFPDVIIGFYSPEEINPDAAIDYETGEILAPAPDNESAAGNGNGQRLEPEADDYARQMQAIEDSEAADAPMPAPKQSGRPYTPRTLLEKLSALTATKLEDPTMSAPLSDQAAQDLEIFIGRILPRNDSRHAFLFAAFGVSTAKSITYAEDAAIRAWVGKGSRIALAKHEADDLLASLDGEGKLAHIPGAA